MKRLQKKQVGSLLIIILAFNFCSCNKDSDNLKEWGIAKVSMPQAAILDGGLTNIYAVPNTGNSSNYLLDTVNNKLNIDLGVTRSGTQAEEAYSVTIIPDTTASKAMIAGGSIASAVLLPAEVYSIPATVSVAAGKREANFYLTIDRKKLLEKYPGYYAKKMVLVVAIADPTKYELNQALCNTTIVINGGSFMPVPPPPVRINLLQGGDMTAASASFWTKMNQDISPRTAATISFTGILSWSNGSTGSIRSNDAVFQSFQVVKGKTYRYSADFTYTGAVNSWFEVHIAPDVPVVTGDYANGLFVSFDTYTSGCFASAASGDMALAACKGPGVGKGGIFTATTTGTMYFVIKAGSYDGHLGTVTLDNVIISQEP